MGKSNDKARAEYSGLNLIDNAGFEIAQRGAGPFGNGMSFDRWFVGGIAGGYAARNLSQGHYDIFLARSVSGPNNTAFFQRLQSSTLRSMLGKTVTVSFEAMAVGAVTTNLSAEFFTTDTEVTYTNTVSRGFLTITPADAPGGVFKKFQFSFPLADSITQLGAYLNFTNLNAVTSTTVGWRIRKIKMEEGSIATPYRSLQLPLDARRCLDFYRNYPRQMISGTGSVSNSASRNIFGSITFDPMRAVPSATVTHIVGGYNAWSGVSLEDVQVDSVSVGFSNSIPNEQAWAFYAVSLSADIP